MFASLGFINTIVSSFSKDRYLHSYTGGQHALFVIYPCPDIDVVNPLDTKFSSWISQNSNFL